METSKRAIILTYYKEPNYGAFLQAYSMQSFLGQNGISAFVYEYNSLSPKIITALYRLVKGRRRISSEKKDYNKKMESAVLKRQSSLNLYHGSDHFDLAILGSDEIWNIRNVYASHDPFLFKKNRKAARTISYAACAGNSEIHHFRFLPYAKRGINSLDAVSVRDDHTERIVKALGRNDVVRVIDPIFLYDLADELPDLRTERPYVFVYSYGLSKEQVDVICDAAKRNDWAIIVTGTSCVWADKNPAPDPFEWVAYLKNAEAVITSTFHGTAFSILFNKNFVVLNNWSHKVDSLLKEIGLPDRRASDTESVINLLKEPIDFTKVNALLKEKQEFSSKFVLKQLEIKKKK